tara:strand:- start:2117 stop:2302 length:186 start_codon:yes stop_codon:yes gene_type:complete
MTLDQSVNAINAQLKAVTTSVSNLAERTKATVKERNELRKEVEKLKKTIATMQKKSASKKK